MKVNMTYNENTKTFLNIAHHIKSEDDRFKAIKPGANAYVLEFSSKRFFGFKLKWHKFKKEKEIIQDLNYKNKQFKWKRDKHAGKKGKTKMTY